ncbi:MAG: hypothetical protein ACK4ND_20165, partial [Cytophagaceae bacterium]
MRKNYKLLMAAIVVMTTFLSAAHVSAQAYLPWGSVWNYLDDGSDQGMDWIAPDFDDSQWASGPAELGFATNSIVTTISFGDDPTMKHICTYFRTKFNFDNHTSDGYVKLVIKRDDGAVIYLNGQEVVRSNMPAGTVTYQTFSASNNMATETHLLPKSLFVPGENTIAVSVHQTNRTSSDLCLNLSIENIPERLIVSEGGLWKFSDAGQDLGTSWREPDFDDAAWKLGIAPLGYTMTGVATTISFGSSSINKYRTSYFRKTIEIPSLATFDSVFATLRIDDGAVVYINGVEVMRRNMPAGLISFNTFANVTVGSTPATFTAMLGKEHLVEGTNVIAVEVHQVTAGSSDLFLDLGLDPIKNDLILVDAGDLWKFNDSGIDLGNSWKENAYDDALWSSGEGAFGYGNGDENTIISFGNNPAAKHMTTYFRKSFVVDAFEDYANLQILFQRDDAAIVYLNGKELHRSNIKNGSITFNTPALTPVEGADESRWFVINVPSSELLIGENVVAVEVHKFTQKDTDLRFDAQLSLQQLSRPETPAFRFVACDPNESSEIACFTSVRPTAQTQGVVLPETHTWQVIAKQGQSGLYSNSSSNMPGNHDFTAYVGVEGSSKIGVVSVNHENNPGDVSLLSVHLDELNKIWVLDSARLVDFAPLVRTSRNCSGGITPWGTVITSEET